MVGNKQGKRIFQGIEHKEVMPFVISFVGSNPIMSTIILVGTKMDIKSEVMKFLKSIRNEFNAYKIDTELEFIDDNVSRVKKFIERASVSSDKLPAMLELIFSNLKFDLILKLKRVSLVSEPGAWSVKRPYAKGEWSTIVDILKCDTSEAEAIKIAKEIDNVYCQGFNEIKRLSVPTGQLVFSNFFSNTEQGYLFSIPKELKYTDVYSINNRYGRQNCMNYLAENFNLGYFQLGNTTCDVFKINDDRIVVGPNYYYDEVTDKDVEPPEHWTSLGSIECAVWRLEFIDKQFLDTAPLFDKERFNNNDSVTVEVTPGDWSLRCYYHYKTDRALSKKEGYPVWAEINRI